MSCGLYIHIIPFFLLHSVAGRGPPGFTPPPSFHAEEWYPSNLPTVRPPWKMPGANIKEFQTTEPPDTSTTILTTTTSTTTTSTEKITSTTVNSSLVTSTEFEDKSSEKNDSSSESAEVPPSNSTQSSEIFDNTTTTVIPTLTTHPGTFESAEFSSKELQIISNDDVTTVSTLETMIPTTIETTDSTEEKTTPSSQESTTLPVDEHDRSIENSTEVIDSEEISNTTTVLLTAVPSTDEPTTTESTTMTTIDSTIASTSSKTSTTMTTTTTEEPTSTETTTTSTTTTTKITTPSTTIPTTRESVSTTVSSTTTTTATTPRTTSTTKRITTTTTPRPTTSKQPVATLITLPIDESLIFHGTEDIFELPGKHNGISKMLSKLNFGSVKTPFKTTIAPTTTTEVFVDACPDLLFVIDSSGNVKSQYEKQKELVRFILLSLGTQQNQLGLVTYAGQRRQRWNIPPRLNIPKDLFLKKLQKARFLGGVTATGAVLDSIASNLEESQRKTNVLVLTDGFSFDIVDDAAQRLRNLPFVNVFTTGDYFPVVREVLSTISGSPKNVRFGHRAIRRLIDDLHC